MAMGSARCRQSVRSLSEGGAQGVDQVLGDLVGDDFQAARQHDGDRVGEVGVAAAACRILWGLSKGLCT